MSVQSSPSWQQPQLSYGLKLLLMFVAALLLIIAIVAFFVIVGMLFSFTSASTPPSSVGSNVLALGIGTVLLLASGFGLYKIFPKVQVPTNFKPAYGTISAETVGHPFEIRFQRIGWGRTMTGKGTAQFNADGVILEGWLTPSPLVQILIIVVVTIAPAVLFGFGLGVIPALIIAYYVGRKKLHFEVPYADVREFNVKGCRVTATIPVNPPGKISFNTAQIDGERLYREVRMHLPSSGFGV